MDKVQIRFTPEQLEAVISALVQAEVTYPQDPHAGQWARLGQWLSHRYTKVWGLPPRFAATLAAARGDQ